MLILELNPDSLDGTVIDRAADALREGLLVAYTTDTFYGLAVDPRRDDAVERLFEVKGRDASTAIPLIAGSIEQAREVGVFTSVETRLAQAFWPGPLTIVVRARPGLSAALLGPGSTIAVRVPAHPVARALAASFGSCVTSTSANRSGKPPASSAAEAAAALGNRLDVIIDAGKTAGGPPSTIVEVRPHGLRLVRAGAVAWERVLRSLG